MATPVPTSRWVVVASLLLVMACSGGEGGGDPTTTTTLTGPSGLTELVVYFKVDPRVTGGVNMGVRWVRPSSFEIVVPPGGVVEAMVVGIVPDGTEVDVRAEWSPEDPDLVTISPSEAGTVDLAVAGTGETAIQLSAHGIEETLYLVATPYQGSTIVTITQ